MAGPDRNNPGCVQGPVQVCRNQAADWTLVLPGDASFQEIVLLGGGPLHGAAAVDWQDSAGNLAGFVVSLPAAGQTVEQVAAGVTDLIKSSGAFDQVEVDAVGIEGRSHDGYPMVAATSLTLTPASSTELCKVRNRLFPALLGLDVTQFAGLPQAPLETSDQFRLLLSTILRPDGRGIVIGGVTTLDGFTNLLGRSRIRAQDMASGTLVGRASALTVARCETLRFALPGEVDMLWVVDGSDSPTISNARVRLHGAAGALWSRARSYSLGLRVAVVDTGQTKEVRLCSPKPSADCPNPGAGGFFGTGDADLACFQACVLKPSGTEEPGTRGLESARNTLLSMLARSDTDPHKLRERAQVALFFASDVEDGSVADLFGGQVPDPLTAQDRDKIDVLVQPLANLLTTSPGSELAGTVAYVLVVDPFKDPSCSGRRGTGYIELVQKLGRGSHDLLCQAQARMDALMESKVDQLAPLASQLLLEHPAASATLGATLNGATIFRSLRRGFDYSPPQNALLLRGLGDSLAASGNRLELSYVGW